MSDQSGVVVRYSRDGDMRAITRIYADAVEFGTSSFETDVVSLQEMSERRRKLVDNGFPYLTAVIDGLVIGYAYAGLYRARLAYGNTVENAIYVDPEYQGKGIGRALLGRLIELCTEAGFRQMIAVVGDSRNAGSIGLHRSAGFQFAGTLHSVGYKHGRWLDTVFMQRTLGEGDSSKPYRENED